MEPGIKDISVRTVQDWEQGRRVPPSYIPGMMLRILEHEFFNKKDSTEKPDGKKSQCKETTGGNGV